MEVRGTELVAASPPVASSPGRLSRGLGAARGAGSSACRTTSV